MSDQDQKNQKRNLGEILLFAFFVFIVIVILLVGFYLFKFYKGLILNECYANPIKYFVDNAGVRDDLGYYGMIYFTYPKNISVQVDSYIYFDQVKAMWVQIDPYLAKNLTWKATTEQLNTSLRIWPRITNSSVNIWPNLSG